MKHNAEEAAQLIKKAISILGNDFSLSEARRYLTAGLKAIDRVQHKREIRDYNYQQQITQDAQLLRDLAKTASWRFNQLEEMLKQEQSKQSE